MFENNNVSKPLQHTKYFAGFAETRGFGLYSNMNTFRCKQLAYCCASYCHVDELQVFSRPAGLSFKEIGRSMSITCGGNSNPDLSVIGNIMVSFTESELVIVIKGSIYTYLHINYMDNSS